MRPFAMLPERVENLPERRRRPGSVRILSLAFVLLASCGIAEAGAPLEVILKVDLTDPSRAVFAPTSANAAVYIASVSSYDGVTLLGFFEGNGQTVDELAICGSLDPLLAGLDERGTLPWVFVGPFAGGWTADDLDLWGGYPGEFFIDFDDFEPALTGSLTFSLAAFSGLPPPGTLGDVIAGPPNTGTVIGQWEAVSGTMPWSCLVFRDGFESMGTGAWDYSTIP